jgi:REP-associated tyrosine transposase
MDLSRRPSGRGGWRPNAGRPRGRPRVAHERRAELDGFKARFPLHVTWRLRENVPRIRTHRAASVARCAISRAHKTGFRVLEFSIQSNHLHCLVEAACADDLARGMQGLAVRLARGWNRVNHRRGTVFAERYHARPLRSPREVRNVIAYILLNSRKHAADRGETLAPGWFDSFSSAPWFAGWSAPLPRDEPWMRRILAEPCPVTSAGTWLAATGWRRWGPLRIDDVPGS